MKHNIIEKYTDENIEKIVQELVFKIISGNSRLFNFRDESA